MRPYRNLLLIVAMVFLGGALLAPWLYWLVHSAWPDSSLAQKPFHRYLDRSLLGLGLLAIWPLFRSLEAKSWADAGLCNPSRQWRRLATGLALGFGSFTIVVILVGAFHARGLNPEPRLSHIAVKALSYAAGALIIAALEEVLFRGAIFGTLRRGGPLPAALFISSCFYATVHFLGKADPNQAIAWNTGLKMLPNMLQNFGDVGAVFPAFLNLVLAGFSLALAYQCTGNLYFSMGLHAGWIFWLRFYLFVTIPERTAHVWFWGTERMIDGWLTTLVLVVTLALLPWLASDPDKGRIYGSPKPAKTLA